jgi:hypothetical protein
MRSNATGEGMSWGAVGTCSTRSPLQHRDPAAIRTVENAIEIAARHRVATLREFTGGPQTTRMEEAHTRAEHGVPSSDFSRARARAAAGLLRGFALATTRSPLGASDTPPPEAETAPHTARPAPPAPRGSLVPPARRPSAPESGRPSAPWRTGARSAPPSFL